mgnify:CR=1 FL=1
MAMSQKNARERRERRLRRHRRVRRRISGTAERPRVESFACSSQPTVDAKLLEPVNPQAIAATIITRLRVHGFIEEDFNAPIEPSAKAAAKR